MRASRPSYGIGRSLASGPIFPLEKWRERSGSGFGRWTLPTSQNPTHGNSTKARFQSISSKVMRNRASYNSLVLWRTDSSIMGQSPGQRASNDRVMKCTVSCGQEIKGSRCCTKSENIRTDVMQPGEKYVPVKVTTRCSWIRRLAKSVAITRSKLGPDRPRERSATGRESLRKLLPHHRSRRKSRLRPWSSCSTGSMQRQSRSTTT